MQGTARTEKCASSRMVNRQHQSTKRHIRAARAILPACRPRICLGNCRAARRGIRPISSSTGHTVAASGTAPQNSMTLPWHISAQNTPMASLKTQSRESLGLAEPPSVASSVMRHIANDQSQTPSRPAPANVGQLLPRRAAFHPQGRILRRRTHGRSVHYRAQNPAHQSLPSLLMRR
jgi:hypothetical protein